MSYTVKNPLNFASHAETVNFTNKVAKALHNEMSAVYEKVGITRLSDGSLGKRCKDSYKAAIEKIENQFKSENPNFQIILDCSYGNVGYEIKTWYRDETTRSGVIYYSVNRKVVSYYINENHLQPIPDLPESLTVADLVKAKANAELLKEQISRLQDDLRKNERLFDTYR